MEVGSVFVVVAVVYFTVLILAVLYIMGRVSRKRK